MALARVRLPRDEENVEEFGDLLGKQPMRDIWVIRLDPEFRDIDGDDGIRQLRRDQFEFL